MAIVRKTYAVQASLYTMLQIFSVSLFEKVELKQLLTDAEDLNNLGEPRNQLKLFDF